MMNSRNMLTQLLREVFDRKLDLEQAVKHMENHGVRVMPFKIGNVVYWYNKLLMTEPMAVKITGYRSDVRGKTKWICGCFTEFSIGDVGKTIYRTKADAEKAAHERNTDERAG